MQIKNTVSFFLKLLRVFNAVRKPFEAQVFALYQACMRTESPRLTVLKSSGVSVPFSVPGSWEGEPVSNCEADINVVQVIPLILIMPLRKQLTIYNILKEEAICNLDML
jgi:hypothetical protein